MKDGRGKVETRKERKGRVDAREGDERMKGKEGKEAKDGGGKRESVEKEKRRGHARKGNKQRRQGSTRRRREE